MAKYGVEQTTNCPHCGVEVQFIHAGALNKDDGIRRFEHPVAPTTVLGGGSTETHITITLDPFSWVRYLRNYKETDNEWIFNARANQEYSSIRLSASRCPRPQCAQLVVEAIYEDIKIGGSRQSRDGTEGLSYLVYPRSASRKPVPQDVPGSIAEDYREACLVLEMSPQASAALSRRCLQALLREKGHLQKDLINQIKDALPTLPSEIGNVLDAVRIIGNFAAHSTKSTSSGEILAVEPGEAEWSLEVLETLFEHYYEMPSHIDTRLEALNKKLKDAGKPPIKTPSP